MNRRSFLSSLAAFAATATLDSERLLWTPTKTIFIPPAPKLEGISLRMIRSFDLHYFDAIRYQTVFMPVRNVELASELWRAATIILTIRDILQSIAIGGGCAIGPALHRRVNRFR